MSDDAALWIDFRGSRYSVTIKKHATFLELKRLLLELLTENGTVHADECIFYKIRLDYFPLSQDLLTSSFPYDDANILDLIDRTVRQSMCRVEFSLYDIRRKPARVERAITFLNAKHCINWTPRVITNDYQFQAQYSQYPGLYAQHEVLFWHISSSSLMQGRLHRRIDGGRRQEIWKEDWYTLTNDRLWYFSLQQLAGLDQRDIICPGSLDLTENIEVKIVDGNTLCLTSKDGFGNQQHFCEYFRARNSVDASQWFSAIRTVCDRLNSSSMITSQNMDSFDNSTFGVLEETIACHEYCHAKQFADEVVVEEDSRANESVRKILQQDLLREKFLSFLQKENADAVKLVNVWCLLEDFDKGHPQSSNPYSFDKHGISIVEKNAIDLDYLERWVGNIVSYAADIKCLSTALSLDPSIASGSKALTALHESVTKELMKYIMSFLATSIYKRAVLFIARRSAKHFQNSRRPMLQKDTSKSAFSRFATMISFRPKAANSTADASSASHSTQLIPGWRFAVQDIDFPKSWWQLVKSSQSMAELKAQFQSSTLAIKRFPSILNDCFNLTLRPLGHIYLTAVMRCNLSYAMNPKIKSTSLFGFVGDSNSSPTVPKSDQPSVQTPKSGEVLVEEINKRHRHGSVRFDMSDLSMRNIDNIPATAPKSGEELPVRKLQWFEESFVGLTIPTSNNVGIKQLAVISVVEDCPLLSLFDATSFSLTLQVRLKDTSKIGPVDRVANAIEVVCRLSPSFSLAMTPDTPVDFESKEITSKWLNTILRICPEHPAAFNIVKKGYLQKRGRLNTAFQWRWFELGSDLKIRYFKDEGSKAYKGSIDLKMLDVNIDGKGVSRFEKELSLNMKQLGRKWVLKGDSESELEMWRISIFELVTTFYNSRGNDGATNSTPDDDEEEDDD